MADGRTTLMILTMMSMFLWLMGYHSYGNDIMATVLGGYGHSDIAPWITGIVLAITGITTFAIASGALGSNFGQIYTIPAVIFSTVILGVFLLPLSFLSEPMIPDFLKTILGLIFGIMLLSTAASFIRGGEF